MASLVEHFQSVVRKFTAHYRYHGLFPSTVQGQAADGTLDLLPDDPELRGHGGLQGVPIRHGLPGFTVEVNQGSNVLLGFEGGDPSKPYATLWRSGTVRRIVLNGGELPLATLGSLVTSGGPGLICTIMPVSPIPPVPGANGAPAVPANLPCLISFSPIPIVDTVTGVDCAPLYGSVSDGIEGFLG